MKGERSKKRPAKLYRYYGDIQYALDVVVNDRFYPTRTVQFNDPFDCATPVSFEADEAQMERKFFQMAADSGEPKEKVLGRLLGLRATNYAPFRQASMEQIKDILSRLSVLCFCEKPDDLLMWAHYGDRHAGVCLEFDTTKDEAWDNFKRVRYRRTYPALNYFRHSLKRLEENTVYLKSRDWKYEGEWRAMAKVPASEYFPLSPKRSLVGVILGCRATSVTVAAFKGVLRGRRPPVRLQRAKLSGTGFNLLIEAEPTEGRRSRK